MIATDVRILPIAADHPGLQALLEESDRLMASLYPAESNHLTDARALALPHVTLLGVLVGGQLAGCGALVRRDRQHAELKRMFIAPAHRGRGFARQLLHALEKVARAERLTMQLETGIHQPEAIALYRSFGFVEVGPFGDYGADPLSLFMAKPFQAVPAS
ncbi:GNAT family N-acetyltransferase [Geminicoccus flavidas]|uniref:GNAT family N-acetyltransferase n=1 Tax=Geminicoccus flavidas TaxID=2506407 RepID=UPI001358AD71|nr:GNAT family N-acetyltransferase [Geminicoccus flavidas]